LLRDFSANVRQLVENKNQFALGSAQFAVSLSAIRANRPQPTANYFLFPLSPISHGK
jgi:hypothetical protein